MKKILVKKHIITREPGYLYFIDCKGDLYKSKMQRGITKAQGKEVQKRHKIEKEKMLF